MNVQNLGPDDEALVEAAMRALQRNYSEPKHTVGAAIRCASSEVYVGVNVESCGYGPCAEPIALGAAITEGNRQFTTVVAVCKRGERFSVLPPCGNCRQMLLDYAPDAFVILEQNGRLVKAVVRELLPMAYQNFE